MAPRKNSRNQAKKEVKPAAVVNKNGVKAEAAAASGGGGAASGGSGGAGGGFSGTKIFTWFMVLALLGVWSSVAVVWLDLVDYDNVIGKLSAYDADGDGDFDVEDAKVLLDEKEAKVPAPKKETLKKDESPGEVASKKNRTKEHPTRELGRKLKAALKEQLRMIHEKIEAQKIAEMALAEVRSILAKEEEERQLVNALELKRQEAAQKAQEMCEGEAGFSGAEGSQGGICYGRTSCCPTPADIR
ncbi:hypothetical protein J4Q44_G00297330 [Coregonus suidteri]|uniref:Aspartyl beta-hydroxylase/Triadin domain-containing protein n=1 Tax=Coregonus suidteri TaxID=861788 RepID=A0AAN8L205_9TELE